MLVMHTPLLGQRSISQPRMSELSELMLVGNLGGRLTAMLIHNHCIDVEYMAENVNA